MPALAPSSVSERAIIGLIGVVQFVNVLDFVIVMPLGPDLARALAIPEAHLGTIGGSYGVAAAVSGLAGAFFLDRFDRRTALAVCMAGLVLGTVAGGFATGFGSLLAARIVAGFFGGPATSLAWSIVASTVPQERRGRAVASVMTAFSFASVLGVPAGLELARQGTWRLPFFVTAGLGALALLGIWRLLPPMTSHLKAPCQAGPVQARPGSPAPRPLGPGVGALLAALVRRPGVRLSYALTAVVMMAGFLVIPNISAYIQGNLSYPRSALGFLYLVGGVISFLTLRATGRLVDRFGSAPVASGAAALLVATLFFGFVRFDLWRGWIGGRAAALDGLRLAVGGLGVTISDAGIVVPVLVVFIAFMASLGARNVAYNTLASKVPSEQDRARFMSLQSAVQHTASAAGALGSSALLSDGPGGSIDGIGRVAGLAMGLTVVAPILMIILERMVRRADPPAAPDQTPAGGKTPA